MERLVRPIFSLGEWLRWREGVLTASRVPALFDAHPYLSRSQLAAEIGGQSQGSNAAMRRGRILEPAVAAAIAEEYPKWDVRKAAEFHLLPDLRLGCTPDYLGTAPGGGALNIQCKTVAPQQWERWQGKAPLGYLLQTATENLILDTEAGVLAVLVLSPSYPLFCFDVPRHEAAEARILGAAAEWWRAWDAGEIAAPADPDGLPEAFDDGSSKDLSDDNRIRELLEEHERLKADASATKSRLGAVEYEIKNRVGPARFAQVPGWLIRFPTISAKEYTVAARTYRRLDIRRADDE